MDKESKFQNIDLYISHMFTYLIKYIYFIYINENMKCSHLASSSYNCVINFSFCLYLAYEQINSRNIIFSNEI